MTAKRNKKIFWCLATAFICLAVLTVCMTSCRLYGTGNGQSDLDQDDLPSTLEDAYEAKILYYETKLQNLSDQMTSMEQQIYLLREDYINGLQSLEKKINEAGTKQPDDDESEAGTADAGVVPQDPMQQVNPEGDGQELKVCEYTYQLKNNFAVLTSYLGNDEHVTVPAAVDGYLVIALADRTFAECDVRSVTLPETIESIGWFTFYGCENLEKVTLPAKLSSIGYASFDGCASTLCLYVKDGSYAEKFANSFGLRCENVN